MYFFPRLPKSRANNSQKFSTLTRPWLARFFHWKSFSNFWAQLNRLSILTNGASLSGKVGFTRKDRGRDFLKSWDPEILRPKLSVDPPNQIRNVVWTYATSCRVWLNSWLNKLRIKSSLEKLQVFIFPTAAAFYTVNIAAISFWRIFRCGTHFQ